MIINILELAVKCTSCFQVHIALSSYLLLKTADLCCKVTKNVSCNINKFSTYKIALLRFCTQLNFGMHFLLRWIISFQNCDEVGHHGLYPLLFLKQFFLCVLLSCTFILKFSEILNSLNNCKEKCEIQTNNISAKVAAGRKVALFTSLLLPSLPWQNLNDGSLFFVMSESILDGDFSLYTCILKLLC